MSGSNLTASDLLPGGLSDTSAPRLALLVASTGGHLTELFRLASRWNLDPRSVWLTFDTPQSRSLLADRNVVYVPYVRSRDLFGSLRAMPTAARTLRSQKFEVVVSTGAAVAMSVLPLARLRDVPTLYIESVSRLDGPSLTGKLLAAIHSAALRTQHKAWSDDRWKFYPNVLSQFHSVPRREMRTSSGPLKVLVTLGTIHPYRFDSVVDAVLATGLVGPASNWQLGATARAGLPGTTWDQVSVEKITCMAKEADVVVTHAGVGSIIGLLEAGIHPVVVPRVKARGEHVDDHQSQIASLVNGLGVATVAGAADLTAAHLTKAVALATVEDLAVKP